MQCVSLLIDVDVKKYFYRWDVCALYVVAWFNVDCLK
jgi:hypothetical protein